MNDPQVEAVVHAQKIAQQIGANQVAVEVFGWALKHAIHLPKGALSELLDIVVVDK